MALVSSCNACNGCYPKLNCKCKLPCALSGPVSNTYPYFSNFPTPPAGLVSQARIGGFKTSTSNSFTPGGSATFNTVAVLPALTGTLVTTSGLLYSPYTGGGPYSVTVVDNNDGTVELIIPAAVLYALINQGAVFETATPQITILAPYLLLRITQTA